MLAVGKKEVFQTSPVQIMENQCDGRRFGSQEMRPNTQDGLVRMCIDYHEVYKVMIENKYLLLKIDNLKGCNSVYEDELTIGLLLA